MRQSSIKILHELEDERCFVQITDIQNLLKTDINAFDTVIIFDTVKAGKLHKNTRILLDDTSHGRQYYSGTMRMVFRLEAGIQRR